jgi:hypothetical protein
MTSLYDAFDPSNFPYLIRYVDLPRDAVSIRRHRVGETLRRTLLAIVVAATLIVAAIGFASPARPSAGNGDPVPGEFRLGPGNQQPPGVVNTLERRPLAETWVPSVPPVVALPIRDDAPSSDPAPGEFRLGPGNQQPPGVVNPLG